jgi:hypothetical protein
MESKATIKQWNPPHSFVAETEEGPGPVASEWTVEAPGNGTCVVRVVHRWFSSTDDWDNEFEGHSYGWLSFFRILRLYLTHFSGQRGSAFQIAIFSNQPVPEIWRSVMSLLAISDKDSKVSPAPAAPLLAGRVEKRGDDAYPELLLLLDQPARGIAHMFAMPMGTQTIVSIRLYLYGDQGAAAVAQAEREWTGWVAEKFPQV